MTRRIAGLSAESAARQAELEAAKEERKARAQKAWATIYRKRASKALSALWRWEKRLARARRAVAKYRRQVSYYQRKGVIPCVENSTQ